LDETRGWWNIMQVKSKTIDGSRNDATWQVNVWRRSSGENYIYLHDWRNGRNYWPTATLNLPVGQWVKIEMFVKRAADNTGRVTIWQDGTLLVDVNNVSTTYPGEDLGWSVNNYGSGLTPSSITTYIDDARIGTAR
jgi:hypothetical protein